MAIGPNPAEAVTAFNRFGLGARPGDLETAASDPRGFLLEELWTANVVLIRDRAPPSGLAAFEAYYLDQQQLRVAPEGRRASTARTGRLAYGRGDTSGRGAHDRPPDRRRGPAKPRICPVRRRSLHLK
jgi:uncharacterized protein (DUF1800 family)